jgi:gas vesicle protein
MLIDSTTLLILSIVFASLSISEKILHILNKKGHLKKLSGFISKNKNKIEESIKSNKSLVIEDDPEISDVLNDLKDMEEIIEITGQLVDLISISQ